MEKKIPEGIIDETVTLTLEELCELCSVDESYVVEMVQMGVLSPKGKKSASWQFSLFQLQRLKKAERLQADLKINLEGVALSLELLDQIDVLRRRLSSLERQLKLIRQF